MNASFLRRIATYKYSSPNSVSNEVESRKDDDRNDLEHDRQDSTHELNNSEDPRASTSVVRSPLTAGGVGDGDGDLLRLLHHGGLWTRLHVDCKKTNTTTQCLNGFIRICADTASESER